MSEYFKSLGTCEKARYVAKLEAVGLTLKDDPYAKESGGKFETDMTSWPPLEYGHIFGYFITRPGVYTLEQLLSWKQLEGYNYFQSNYVRSVYTRKIGNGGATLYVLKAYVNPSQRTPHQAHQAWVVVKSNGYVVTAHCTCMAGLGEGCSHIAAILFKVECAVRLGYTSLTSHPCRWNEAYCKEIKPAPIAEICFNRPKRGCEQSLNDSVTEVEPDTKKIRLHVPTDTEEKQFFSQLKQILPKSAILTAVEPVSTYSKRPPTRRLPVPLTALQDVKYQQMEDAELKAVSNDLFLSGLSISKEEAEYLEESTKLQAQCLLWFKYRTGRITASRFGPVSRACIYNPPVSLVKDLMKENHFNSSKVPTLQWGISNEPNACKAYIERAQEKHEDFCYQAAGLFVNPDFPHLGASPDGLISCKCCGEGLIEIKCPYKYREQHPITVIDSKFYLQPDVDGDIRLSKRHDYYLQIQGQLAICNKEYCDFICWTPHGMYVERIIRDVLTFDSIRPSLDAFFKEVLLPLLLRGPSSSKENQAPNTTNCDSASTRHYCWCQQEESGRMVACDNPDCAREWFHFECVGLTRKPHGKWYCSNQCKSNR